MNLEDALLIFGAFIASMILTGVVRQYALKSSLLDIPNDRSMHKRPTPRGGGLAIVAVVLVTGLYQALNENIDLHLALALLGGGFAVATVGWLDDRYTLSNRIRMSVWIPTAVWGIFWLDGLPSLDLGFFTLKLGIAGSVLAVIGIVWMLNLYNFMDGTDGIAGTEAVMAAGVAGGILLWGDQMGLAVMTWLVGAAAAGFLVWNLPPAKIFMGDVSSGFLGYTFAVLAIASENAAALPLALWGVLLGLFIVDTTLTVLRRVTNREPWYEAHRSHAYQVLARRWRSHGKMLSGVVLVNFVLAAMVLIASLYPRYLLTLAIASVVGLTATWMGIIRKGEGTDSFDQ